MSSSILFHAFGISGFQLKKAEYLNDTVVFHLEQSFHNLRCPLCKSSHILRRGKRDRKFRSIPIGNKKIFIMAPHQRVECLECKSIRYINLDFAEPKKRHTRAFRKYAFSLLEFSTIRDVANHLGTGWDLIKDIYKSNSKQFQRHSLTNVSKIAIDEIYLSNTNNYITVVLDTDTGAIIHFAKGKGSDRLKPFWKKLKHSNTVIEAVAFDMSPAYKKAISDNIPEAAHVTDPFHVVKLFNNHRSQLHHELINKTKDVLKKP